MSAPDVPPTIQVAPVPPAPRPSAGPFAILALVVGIVAFLSGLAPLWGILAGGAAVALGALALYKKQGKRLAIAGLVLGGLAMLASLGTTAALFSGIAAASYGNAKPAAVASSEPTEQPTTTPAPKSTATAKPTPTPTPTATQPPAPVTPPPPVETASQTQATRLAESYLAYSGFSRSGLIGQLQYEGFSVEDATYGTDAVGADWATQAAIVAQSYLDYSAFSHSGLVDQLIYEGFSPEEAEFGVAFVGL